MQTLKDVDFGRTHDDYKAYRRGFPGEFFDRLVEDEVIKEGMTVLDLGTGTGTVARGFAKRDAVVIGLDKSELLLREAKALDAEDNVTVCTMLLEKQRRPVLAPSPSILLPPGSAGIGSNVAKRLGKRTVC